MTTAPRLLTVDGLHAGYAGAAVVRDLSMHVDAGEFVALLGSNGAGKTTTLLTISGLLPAIAGSITAFGAAVTTRRPHRLARAGLAHVPEDRALFPDLTVRQNLRLGSTEARRSRPGARLLPRPRSPAVTTGRVAVRR